MFNTKIMTSINGRELRASFQASPKYEISLSYAFLRENKGRKEFRELLLSNMSDNRRPLLNIDISLYFIDMLDKEEAIEKLTDRSRELRKLVFFMKAQQRSAESGDPRGKEAIIISHNIKLAETELQFLKDVAETIKQQ